MGKKVDCGSGTANIGAGELGFRSSERCQPVSSCCGGIRREGELKNEGFARGGKEWIVRAEERMTTRDDSYFGAGGKPNQCRAVVEEFGARESRKTRVFREGVKSGL